MAVRAGATGEGDGREVVVATEGRVEVDGGGMEGASGEAEGAGVAIECEALGADGAPVRARVAVVAGVLGAAGGGAGSSAVKAGGEWSAGHVGSS